MFSSLRQGAPFYVLTKGEGSSLKIGTVEEFTSPQPKYPTTYSYNPQAEGVMDIIIKAGDQRIKFENLPASASICNYNGSAVVVSDSREAMTAEIEAYQRSSQAVLDSVETNKANVERCQEYLKILNPQFAKEQEQSEKIISLESRMGGIENTLQNIQGLLSSMSKK